MPFSAPSAPQCYILCMSTGKKITQLREEVGMHQNVLAKKLGVHYQSIGRWERDEVIPDGANIIKLCALFKVTADYLLFDNVPRDGRVDIHDSHLMQQFERIDLLDEPQRAVVKELLDAFILKGKLQKDIAELDQRSTKAKR